MDLSTDRIITAENITLTSDDPTTVETALKYRCNPNLLDNWYFGNPVNQRGETEYTATGYMVDRWIQGFDGTLTSTLTDDGIKIMAGNDGTYKNFEQKLPYVPTNTTFTVSFLVDNFVSIAQIYTGFSTSYFDIRDNLITLTFKTGGSISGAKTIGIQVKVGKTATIKAAKLELGSEQTLAHKEGDTWVLNEIPDYGEQLRRCQRYAIELCNQNDTYQSLGLGQAFISDAGFYFSIPLPVTMRTTGVLTAKGNFVASKSFNAAAGVWLDNARFRVDHMQNNSVTIAAYPRDTSQLVDGETRMLWSVDAVASLFISADL